MNELLRYLREYIGDYTFFIGKVQKKEIRGGNEALQEIMRKNHGALVYLVHRLERARDPNNPDQDLLEAVS